MWSIEQGRPSSYTYDMPDSLALPQSADVVVVGGGHNGLAAAAYLAKAGLAVAVVERQPQFGGAAISAEAFAGYDARLSRYSYLVSLMPERIRDDLKLPIQLIRRRYSSYTPVPGTDHGLLIDNHDPDATRESFHRIGAADDYQRWVEFYTDTTAIAKVIFPTVLDPVLTRSDVQHRLDQAAPGRKLWERFFETPIIQLVNETFSSDIVRGVVLTDALIGTFPNSETDFATNICFLYHVIGGGTGDWHVPVGGMGSVSGSLERAARDAGASLFSSCTVTAIDPEGHVTVSRDGAEYTIEANVIVAGLAPRELYRLTGQPERALPAEGAQVKVNLLLNRLPRLLDEQVSPEQAFGGTFHINELGSQLQVSIEQAWAGEIPSTIPCEIYCHSLSDPSILGADLIDKGVHTLTVFALNVPHRLVDGKDPDEIRGELERAVLNSLNSVLAEPIEDCLMLDSLGRPCVETKTTADLDSGLGLPGGNIFHQALSWPFVDDDTPLDTPALRWGVDTGYPKVVCAGSGALRGGGVSAIGGHNAAMATLELLGLV